MTEAAIINIFSCNLRLIIKARGKTIYSAAKTCGIPKVTMFRLANGRGHASIKNLEKITDGLNCTVGELYEAHYEK